MPPPRLGLHAEALGPCHPADLCPSLCSLEGHGLWASPVLQDTPLGFTRPVSARRLPGSSSPDLSPELQARISTCLLDISTWMSHRYLKLHMSKMRFIFYFFLPSPNLLFLL